MDLTTLGRTLGFSFAAGVNLYATVAILGLASRYGWVSLPPQFQAFNSDIVIGAAVVMYLIEFFADKIPYVDTLWDAVHTAIRKSATREAPLASARPLLRFARASAMAPASITTRSRTPPTARVRISAEGRACSIRCGTVHGQTTWKTTGWPR